MIFNLSSKIIKNILLYDIELLFHQIAPEIPVAISPIILCEAQEETAHHIFIIETALKKIQIIIITEHFLPKENEALHLFLLNINDISQSILQFLLKKPFHFSYHYREEKEIVDISSTHQFFISVNDNDIDKNIRCICPNDFFRLFSKKITKESSPDIIEDEILHYFKNPLWVLPDLKTIILTMNEIELGILFNDLKKKNLLTTYQIYLIIQAYPEVSLKIKQIISKNTAKDVLNLKKQLVDSKIKRRDLVGGIYSLEESVYFLIKSGSDFHYSRLLSYLQKIVISAINSELLLKKSFDTWVNEMVTKNLLYKTITKSSDIITAKSISRNSDHYISIIEPYISKKKLLDITDLINSNISYEELLNAQLNIIQIYRKLLLQELHVSYKSYEYLLNRFSKKTDYINLLLSVGWFTLSTSLKNVKKKYIKNILVNIPDAPRLLIEDVLKGVVNPNILHDELQISKTKQICVNAIMELYEEGLINLNE